MFKVIHGIIIQGALSHDKGFPVTLVKRRIQKKSQTIAQILEPLSIPKSKNYKDINH